MSKTTSTEIYHDVDDFWTWVHSRFLADLLAQHSTPKKLDLSRI